MEEENDLLDYIMKESNKDPENEKAPYKNRIKEINMLLLMNGFSEMGDLFDSSLFSVNKTLNVIQLLLGDRQKFIDSKTELVQKISKQESELYSIHEKFDGNKEKLNEMTNKINFLKNKATNDEKKFKEESEKLRLEKLEAERAVNRVTMKESRYKHEYRKLEKETDDLRNKLRKVMFEKEPERDKKQVNLGKTINNTNLSMANYSEMSCPNTKMSGVLNTFTPEFESVARNTDKALHNVNHLKEFYNLIYQALSGKLSHVISENQEMRECYKLILKELNEMIEFKKIVIYKISHDSLEHAQHIISQKNQNLLRENMFDLDFNENRETILNNFNDILNTFRFLLIYDVLKIDPLKEFDYDEMKRQLNNNKFDYTSIPYYNDLKKVMDSFDFDKLKKLKEVITNSKLGQSMSGTSSSTQRKKNISKDNVFIVDSQSERLSDNKALWNLEELNKEMAETFGDFDEKLSQIEKDIEDVNNCNEKGN